MARASGTITSGLIGSLPNFVRSMAAIPALVSKMSLSPFGV